jgi:YD repeat-containing protein
MPDTASRARLRSIIAEIEETQQRLAALEQAQTRAREQSWHMASNLAEVTDALQRVTSDERRRLAYEFANDAELADPVSDARSRVATAQSEADRLTEVEAALAAEVERTQSALRQLRANQYDEMAQIVCTSDEYGSLIEEHTAAWQRLRTVKTALKTVQSALHGQMPQSFMDEALRAEPLEVRIGFPVDPEPIERWAAALAALEQDANAELPNNV